MTHCWVKMIRLATRLDLGIKRAMTSTLITSKATRISSPNPTWKPGENQPIPSSDVTNGEAGKETRINYTSLNPFEMKSSYFLLISGVVPRPIALISSVSSDGIGNTAPFSYFAAVAHDPPTLCIGICKNRDGSDKDSLRNIKQTSQFVVNIMSEWFVESANHTCGNFPPDIDEMAVAGLTPIPSVRVKPPRVSESAFQMECELTSITDIKNDKGDVTSSVVFGRIVMFHVLDSLVQTSEAKGVEVKIDGYKPVGRLGGDTYATIGDYFDIPRPRIV